MRICGVTQEPHSVATFINPSMITVAQPTSRKEWIRIDLASLVGYLSQCRDSIIYEGYRNRYPQIDDTFKFNGPGIEFYGDGEIICGGGSYIGKYSTIQAVKGTKVTVGLNCAISHYVKIYTMNRDPDQDMRNTLPLTVSGSVTIGNYCWIGVGAFIDAGVSIGENSVVGANSVVTRELPPHCIAYGNPVRIHRFKSYLSEEERYTLGRKYRAILSEELRSRIDAP
jgi:acetyltransferase-like isoleucine patch superfamily enzyme